MSTKAKPKAEKGATKRPKVATEAPKKMGRPSLYRPEYCAIAEEMGREGASPIGIASAIGVDRTTLIRWGEEHDEFRTALARARVDAQAWWEEIGRAGIGQKPADFNAQHWKTVMANRFREDYTEKQAVEVSGPGGGPITVNLNVNFRPPPRDA